MKILHLYKNLMNLYGDYGNLSMLKRVLSQKGYETEIASVDIGEAFNPAEFDMIYIGSGTERNQKAMLEDIKQYSDALREAVDFGTVMLCTGNSFEIFGAGVSDKDGTMYKGLGWYDFITEETKERTVIDVKCSSNMFGGEIIGFINKCSEIHNIKNPLFVSDTDGNTKGDSNEGINIGNFYGTHLIGPLLVRNPAACEYFANLLINNSKAREQSVTEVD